MTSPFSRTIAGLVVVRVEVVGPSARLIIEMAIDTGATRTVINTRPLRYVGIDPAADGIPWRLTTPSGVARAHIVDLPALRCLGRTRRQMEVAAQDLPPATLVDGLLGLDFLGEGRLELDFAAGTITLT